MTCLDSHLKGNPNAVFESQFPNLKGTANAPMLLSSEATHEVWWIDMGSGWQLLLKKDGAQANADGSPRNPWNVYASISGATKTAVLAKLNDPGGFMAELRAALA